MSKETVHGKCAEYIAIAEQEERIAIKTDWLTDKVHAAVDLSDMTREDLERRYIKAAVSVCLCQKGYRSVVIGHGYYVKPDIDSNPAYVEQIIENVEDSEMAKRITKYGLQNVLKEIKNNYERQMWFDEDSEYHTNPTVDELLEMLAKDA